MNQFYDEDDINEQHARDLYYTIRDAVSQACNNELPLSLAGIAAAIADEFNAETLNKLLAELDKELERKINKEAKYTASAPKKANEGISVASRGIVDDNEVIKIAKILDERLAEQAAIVKKQCQAMESFAEQIKRVLKI